MWVFIKKGSFFHDALMERNQVSAYGYYIKTWYLNMAA